MVSYTNAQFAPAADEPGSTAIHSSDATISFWANNVEEIKRGWLDIADTSMGKVDFGAPEDALGASNTSLVSLGDSGSITLSFPFTITDEPGFDIAVFENTFPSVPFQDDHYFVELGHVSVSYDGVNFINFPATSLTDTTTQLDPFGYINVREVNNLVGKYEAGYGVPFDLNEIGIDSIRYLKITDAVGTMIDSLASRDNFGNKINDPYPTPFASGGVDVEAVAALNQLNVVAISEIDAMKEVTVFPNPVFQSEILHIQGSKNKVYSVEMFDLLGKRVLSSRALGSTEIETIVMLKGAYFLKVSNGSNIFYEQVHIH